MSCCHLFGIIFVGRTFFHSQLDLKIWGEEIGRLDVLRSCPLSCLFWPCEGGKSELSRLAYVSKVGQVSPHIKRKAGMDSQFIVSTWFWTCTMSELVMKTCQMLFWHVCDMCKECACLCVDFALHSMFAYVCQDIFIYTYISIAHCLNMLLKKDYGNPMMHRFCANICTYTFIFWPISYCFCWHMAQAKLSQQCIYYVLQMHDSTRCAAHPSDLRQLSGFKTNCQWERPPRMTRDFIWNDHLCLIIH